MRRFKNILFAPLADSLTAAQRTEALAVRNRAAVTVVGVQPEPSRFQRALHRGADFEAIRTVEREAIAARLDRHRPKQSSLGAETKTLTGDVAIAIIHEVLRRRHDLVVVACDEEDDDQQAVINRLFRKCPCPVWVIRATPTRRFRVLAAVNPDPSEAELNRTILELAASLGSEERDELHVAHAWELYGENMLRHSAFMHTPDGEFEALLEEEAIGRRRALTQLLVDTGLDREDWQVHLEKGKPTQVVPRIVTEHRITTLVMGTVARTGVSGLLIGNTAERILDHVRCSVIAVKPTGFQTPIRLAEA